MEDDDERTIRTGRQEWIIKMCVVRFREITLRRVLADITNVSRELWGLFRGQLLGQQGYVKDD